MRHFIAKHNSILSRDNSQYYYPLSVRIESIYHIFNCSAIESKNYFVSDKVIDFNGFNNDN